MELVLLFLLFAVSIFAWWAWSAKDEAREEEYKAIAKYETWIKELKVDHVKSEGRYAALERGYDEMQTGLEQIILDHQENINALLDENVKLRAQLNAITLKKNTR